MNQMGLGQTIWQTQQTPRLSEARYAIKPMPSTKFQWPLLEGYPRAPAGLRLARFGQTCSPGDTTSSARRVRCRPSDIRSQPTTWCREFLPSVTEATWYNSVEGHDAPSSPNQICSNLLGIISKCTMYHASTPMPVAYPTGKSRLRSRPSMPAPRVLSTNYRWCSLQLHIL